MARRAPFIAALCCGTLAGLGAAEAQPDASQFLPVDPLAVVRVNDIPRTVLRYAETPYPRLLATPWGQLGKAQLERVIGEAGKRGIDINAAVTSLHHLVGGVAWNGDLAGLTPWASLEVAVGIATVGDTAPMQALAKSLLPVESPVGENGALKAWVGGAGQITQIGQLFVFKSADGKGGAVSAPQPTMPATAAGAADSCLEATFNLSVLAKLMAKIGQAPKAGLFGSEATFSMKLDPIGIRERLTSPGPTANAGEWQALHFPAADRAVLASLPATTLFALALRSDSALTGKALELSGIRAGAPELAQVDALLAQVGLPAYLELLQGIDGDSVIYCEEGAPFPSFTAAVGMKADLAGKLLPLLKARLNMADNGDGSLTGILGFISLNAAYLGQQLVLTSNPLGVTAYSKRQPGFANHPEIQKALAEIPAGALVAGVSRSGASWGAFAQLAMLPLSQLGVPQLMSLPQDLRANGKYGFLYYARTDSGYTLESGGLFGGLFGMYGLAGGAAGLVFVQRAMPAPPAAAPAPGAAKPDKDLVF